MTINSSQPRFRQEITLFIAFVLVTNVLPIFLALSLESLAESQIKSLKNIQSKVNSEERRINEIARVVNNLKTNYGKINKKLLQESNFDEGLRFVLSEEGGLTNDKADTGGLTNLGITHTEYDSYRTHKGLPARSITEISLSEASDIYRHTYWLDSGCGYTPRRVAISCFDWEVNSGRGFSTLKRVLGMKFGTKAQVYNEVDYWERKQKEQPLLHDYFGIREDSYRHWGVGSQSVFLEGWLNRLHDLKQYLNIN